MALKTYTVLVYSPAPALRGGNPNYSTPRGPQIKTVNAESPEKAAEKANVPAGGRCHVVVESRMFTRAETAPLVEVPLS